MKVIRYSAAFLVFLVACPLSWLAAWDAGTWFTVGMSLLVPTFGIIYWGLLEVMDHGFFHTLLSWILGFGGAFITLMMISALAKD